jgi:3-phenylpropionate/trans-cinnamate dioxygenase ferredoxin reductase component
MSTRINANQGRAMERIVIVGAGHGGVQAAASLREEGYQGEIALISDEAVPPYHRPPLSKAFLKDKKAELQSLRGPRFYEEHGVDLRLGVRVISLDLDRRRVLLDRDEALEFSALVLALGGRPRRLALPGGEPAGVHSLLSAAEGHALREMLYQTGEAAIIGGGFIGMEVAATVAALGAKVTVIEATPRVLGRAVAPLISEHMRQRHQSWGVEIVVGESVERIDSGATGVAGLVTTSGRRVPASLIVVGVGMTPNIDLARAAGLSIDNGIAVDGQLRTSHPDVFAIGDCASYPHWSAGRRLRLESVQNATDQGRAVAKAIVGRGENYRAAPWFWSDQQHIKLQMVGLSFDADDHVVSGDREADRFSVFHFKGARLLAIDSVNSPADHMLGRRMIAAGFSPTKDAARGGAATLKATFAATSSR